MTCTVITMTLTRRRRGGLHMASAVAPAQFELAAVGPNAAATMSLLTAVVSFACANSRPR